MCRLIDCMQAVLHWLPSPQRIINRISAMQSLFSNRNSSAALLWERPIASYVVLFALLDRRTSIVHHRAFSISGPLWSGMCFPCLITRTLEATFYPKIYSMDVWNEYRQKVDREYFWRSFVCTCSAASLASFVDDVFGWVTFYWTSL